MSIVFWKLVKTLLISLIIVVVLLLNYLFFAWLLSRIPTTPYPLDPQLPQYDLYISTNGVHVDVVVPTVYLGPAERAAWQVPDNIHYLGLGWGDRGFYLNTPSWAELDWRVAFKAAFLPSSTLMHVTHYTRNIPYERWYQAQVTPAEMNQLLDFAMTSFKRNEQGELLLLEGEGYGERDFFYEAQGNYTLFYTCNVWANQALKKANVKTGIWSPFDWGIVRHLERVP